MASQNPSRYASDNRGRATFPILFKKVLTVLGTLHPSAGEHSAGNWDDEVSSNALEVHIYNLRQKLGKQFIRTVHGVGYALGNNEE